MATLSGPIPGLFQGSPYGADAYFAMVNSQGGVNGRKIAMVSADDALNCNENKKQSDALTGSTPSPSSATSRSTTTVAQR